MKVRKRAAHLLQRTIAIDPIKGIALLTGTLVFLSCSQRPTAPIHIAAPPAAQVPRMETAEPSEILSPEVAATDEIVPMENQPEEIPEQSDAAEPVADELKNQTAALEEAAKNSSMEAEISAEDMISSVSEVNAKADGAAAKANAGAATQTQAAAGAQTIRLYRFAVSSNNVTYCLDMANKSRQAGAGLAYLPCDNTLSQFFAAQSYNGVFFRLVNANSGQCLTNTGAALVQAPCAQGAVAQQLLRFPAAQGGGNFIVTYSGTCLLVNGQCVRNGIFANDFAVNK
jgi:hypothetical protein